MSWSRKEEAGKTKNSFPQATYGGVDNAGGAAQKGLEEGAHPEVQAKVIQRSEETDLLPPSCGPRVAYLDASRIAAVVCVAVDHGARRYGVANAMFTQNWVLQTLYLTSGVSLCLSTKPTSGYLLRLGAYAGIGSCVNLVAWIIAGDDWKNNIFNVVFQFWFVVCLMIIVVILEPVKQFLKGVRAQLDSGSWSRSQLSLSGVIGVLLGVPLILRISFVYGVGTLLSTMILGSNPNEQAAIHLPNGLKHWLQVDSRADIPIFISGICRYVAVSISSIFLAMVGPRLLQDVTMVSWLVITNTYLDRLVYYDGSEERPFHALDLVTLAIVCYYLGMKNRRKIGDLMMRYWMVVFLILGLLWPPYLQRRLDEEPPTTHLLRFQYYSIEVILVVWWLVAGERFVDPAIFSQDKLGFLCDWALLVFLLHKAIHVVVPPPFNWVIILALIFPCWARAVLLGKA
mmetsp:Transcript_121254/g.213788  ORF Transcript_121254/g.213788 Transcript_121254/m.213788 type:complete len:456 (-) Transcript_121254:24-1391(-)